MPVRKFRHVSEMEGNTWHEPGTPALFRAIRGTWTLARKTLEKRFPPGVYKHHGFDDAERLSDEWARANFARYQARQRAARIDGENGRARGLDHPRSKT